ncbi:hypothetical protein BKA62DRAFT_703724 [Auriculariales sp. MPI-PUGE-AT-0066]|nr:hypothetical protein BKA62DRAFT_703724 [Auriculariales sp. MPI-PUGE-AT-0066]
MSASDAAQIIQLAETIATLRGDIRLWLGASQLGILIASCFYGANLVQLYLYATSGRRDALWIVILVAWIWALDTIHTGFIWSWLFDKTVLDAADIGRTLLVFEMTDALAFSVTFSGLIGASVQSFYAYRLGRLARHPWFSILSWAGSLARAGLSIVVTVCARQGGTLNVFVEKYMWTLFAVLGVSVGVDVFNTGVVCILLARQRDGMQMTSTMISKLTLWTVETGFLTSACALGMLGLTMADKASVCPALMHVYAKLFAFSLLVTLNGRDRLRNAIASSTGPVTPLSASRPALVSVTHHKEPAFELVGRSFRSDGPENIEHIITKQSFIGLGIAHGDPEASLYHVQREEDFKAVAPWETGAPLPTPPMPSVPRSYRSNMV